MQALGDSISLGRYMTESLSWEKWSPFTSRRYVEEAKSYVQPGSVAKKKAFFEAYYKKIAAPIHNTEKTPIGFPDTPAKQAPSTPHRLENVIPPLSKSSTATSVDERRSPILKPGKGLVYSTPDKEASPAARRSNSSKVSPLRTTVVLSEKGMLEDASATTSSEKRRTGAAIDLPSSVTAGPKWHLLSSVSKSIKSKLKSPVLSKPFRFRTEERAARRKQKLEDKFNSTTKEAEKVQQQKTTLKEKAGNEFRKLRRSLYFSTQLPPDYDSETTRERDQVNNNPKANHMQALGDSISFGRYMTESLPCEKWSTSSSRRYVEEAKSYAQPGSVAQKKAFIEAHYKKRRSPSPQPGKGLVYSTPEKEASPAARRGDRSRVSPLRTPVVVSEKGMLEDASATTSSDKRRTGAAIDPPASVSKTAGPKWHLLSSGSKSIESKLKSPALSKPFRFRTEERAARRKQKLEDKFNNTTKEAEKMQQQKTTLKDKAGTEFRKLRRSLCFSTQLPPDYVSETTRERDQVNNNPKTLLSKEQPTNKERRKTSSKALLGGTTSLPGPLITSPKKRNVRAFPTSTSPSQHQFWNTHGS